MAVPVTMPQMGESVVDGTVARWLKQPGDPVDRMEPLLDISTDKIDTEVPAPAAGTLLRILVEEGETVAAGTVIAYIGEAGEHLEGEPADGAGQAETPQSAEDSSPAPTGEDSQADPRPRGRDFISPVVARMAQEHELDLQRIQGTGLHGRITKKDVLAHLASRGDVDDGTSQGDQETSPPQEQAPPAEPGAADRLGPDEILQPLTTMRRLIAEHMVRSVGTSPHVTAIHEADMTAVVAHREAHKAEYAEKGVRLTFTPYFLQAVAGALRAVPRANARFTEEGMVLNRRIHLGMAVAVEDGLVVPVIRDADERNLAGLARQVNQLSERARSGRLTPDEVQGGTFTLTNHGMGSSLAATPIINQPQSGILGVGAIVKRPVVRSSGDGLLPSADDAIVIRPMCYLSFSFDHRVLDGAEADAFVQAIVGALQAWER